MKKDRERAVYGLKEKNLARTYIKLIPLGMKDADAVRLLNWKKPTEKDVRLPPIIILSAATMLLLEIGWGLSNRTL